MNVKDVSSAIDMGFEDFFQNHEDFANILKIFIKYKFEPICFNFLYTKEKISFENIIDFNIYEIKEVI